MWFTNAALFARPGACISPFEVIEATHAVVNAPMHACPHCSEPSFSPLRKFRSSGTFPGRCPACGGLAFVSGWGHALSSVVLETSFWGALFVALLFRRWVALALFPLALLVWSLVVSSTFPLRPIEREAVSAARFSAVGHALIAAVVLAAVLLLVRGAH
jgi:hypothetical protein